jgi:hypothetical protein
MSGRASQLCRLRAEYESRLHDEKDTDLRAAFAAKARDLACYDAAIDAVVRAMTVHREARPYVVFCIPASFALVSYLVSAAFTFLASVATFYYRSKN